MPLDPQNPYQSFVVSASAGSGKTYQLAQRYLHLVASHCDIDKILCLTFTRKAAEEMRSRVMETALGFQSLPESRTEFESKSLVFWNENGGNNQQPLSALETSDKILSEFSSIDITTMDSIFQRWTSQHTFEAMLPMASESPAFIPDYAAASILTSSVEWSEIFNAATAQTVKYLIEHLGLKTLKNTEIAKDFSTQDFLNRAEGILANESFIWSLEASDSIIHSEKSYLNDVSLSALSIQILPELLAMVDDLKDFPEKQNLILQLEQDPKDIKILQQIISLKSCNLQHSFLNNRSKIRAEIAYEIKQIFDQISIYQSKLRQARSDLCFEIYRFYQNSLQKIKHRKKVINFSDLVKGAYRIFHHDENIGAQYQIQCSIRHLLIDEFQDTSALQWRVFEPLVNEILSGNSIQYEDGQFGSFFCVGDTKQSIFGFREADASIMQNLKSEADGALLQNIELDRSYRSCQGVLDFINSVFKMMPLQDFRMHQSAFDNNKKSEIRFLSDESNFSLERECELIVEALNELTHQGVPLGNCCVLFPFSTDLNVLIEAFDRGNISYKVETSRSLFEESSVSDLVNLIKLIVFPGNLSSLWVLAKSPVFGLLDSDLSQLFELDETLQFDRLMHLLQNHSPETFSTFEKLLTHSERFFGLEYLREVVDFMKCSYDPIEYIYFETIYDLAVDFYNDSAGNLLSFSMHLEKLSRDSNSNLNIQVVDKNAVSLMTIHKSKGLEFEMVFVMDLMRSWARSDHYWIKDLPGKTMHYVGTKAEFEGLVEDLRVVQSQNIAEENLRLLYVALTRAKTSLFLSGHLDARSKKVGGYWENLLAAKVETKGL